MSTDAIRSYLRALREAQGISQKAVADTLGIQVVSWGRQERGESEEITADMLFKAMRFLKGSFRDLQELAADGADTSRGAELARHRADEIARGELSAYRETVSDAEFEALLNELDQIYAASNTAGARLRAVFSRLRGGGGVPPA